MKALYKRTVTLGALNADTGVFPSGIPQLTGASEIGIGVDIPEVWIFSITGTWVGRIDFYVSADNINFFPVALIDVISKAMDYTEFTTKNGIFKSASWVGGHGALVCKAVMTAYTSGTANVVLLELHQSRED